jgi:hypothetical protein
MTGAIPLKDFPDSETPPRQGGARTHYINGNITNRGLGNPLAYGVSIHECAPCN